MQFSFLVSSLSLLANPAFAEENDEDTVPEPTPVEEIIVHGEMEIQRKRTMVIQNLRHLGYRSNS